MAKATFMITVRSQMLAQAKELHDRVYITYGAKTKLVRKKLCQEKNYINDAYCIGKFHPKHRTGKKNIPKRRKLKSGSLVCYKDEVLKVHGIHTQYRKKIR